MSRLLYVIVFTPEIERMKSFYRDSMGFEVTTDSPYWVSFATGGASLALMAMHPSQKREFELCLHSTNIDSDVRALRARGMTFFDTVKSEAFGRVIHMRDPEGNLLSLLEPVGEAISARGPSLTAAVLNCRDMSAARAWYRDKLGLPIRIDSPWWAEFDAGETHVALHPVVDHDVLEIPPAAPVAVGFAAGDLDEWVEELKLRGVEFTMEITDRGFGRFAEAVDPDGNTLVLRDSHAPPTLEEKLAEEYESEDAPHLVAIRRTVNKNSKAMSRLAVKPEYHVTKHPAAKSVPVAAPGSWGEGADGKSAAPGKSAKRAAGRGRSKTAASKRSAPSVRGAGPGRTRLKPARSNDSERVRTKPAVGHQKKATARSLDRQKNAAAIVSRTKPLKRTANRVGATVAGSRGGSLRGAASRGKSSRTQSSRSGKRR
ncbi:MAG: VOC family protein [Candidatus Eisenbacteria bacterium]|nr:VOC family protein [Candidatus Eisenbacteria bacterium]